MTPSAHPNWVVRRASGADIDANAVDAAAKRPPRWSVGNWPVGWKVLAIVLVPLALVLVFGGLRISGALTDAASLRLTADRAKIVPSITNYMSALDNALIADSTGGDIGGAKKNYESRKYELQTQLARTDVAADVNSGATTLLNGGQALLDKVSANSIGLRDRVTTYAPILLTAEDAINGSVRVDSEEIRAQTEGLSRAVGARGQMVMQQLLITRGGEIPEPELRSSMIALAGTEPSTLFGMSQVLGVGTPEAKDLQKQMVTRLATISDPASALVDNPDLLRSIKTTSAIASRVIKDTNSSVTAEVERQAADRRGAAIRDIIVVLSAVVVALAIVLLVARSLVRPLRILRDSALKVAHEDLEHEIARVRAGDEREPTPLPVYTTEEVGQVAHAVDELHAQALLLAGDEARLRLLVNDMFETMSRRNRSLVDQQLSLIDRLERNEEDPDRLDSLFRLDHLAARMRRNGANLLVLAGAQTSRDQTGPIPLSTVISGAVSEVEDYHRVETTILPDSAVTGAVAGDLVHLLAELIDNALRYSPPTSSIQVAARHTGGAGLLVEISDTGLGMTDTDLRIANMRLASGGEVSPDSARHMGLFVISRLAQKHGIRVRLRASLHNEVTPGTTTEVHVPLEQLVGAAVANKLSGSEASAATPWSTAALDEAPDAAEFGQRAAAVGAAERNGSYPAETPVSLLPRRTPGSSGITGAPTEEPVAATDQPDQTPRRELPLPWWEKALQQAPEQPVAPEPAATPAPSDTSAYFSSRSRVEREAVPGGPDLRDMDALAAKLAAPPIGSEADLIYQRMLSEWLVDPHELARSADLDWKSVWDHGWSVAAEVENVPVAAHTDHGLPVREPGARLIPGAATADAAPRPRPTAHRRADEENGVASNGGFHSGRTPQHEAPSRDPDAIRASMSSHFGGVRAGRSHARETSQDQTHQAWDHQ